MFIRFWQVVGAGAIVVSQRTHENKTEITEREKGHVSCGDWGHLWPCVVAALIFVIFSVLCKVVNLHGIGCSVVTGKSNHILIVRQEPPWLRMKQVQSAVINDEILIY
jgi:hypothetical protein